MFLDVPFSLPRSLLPATLLPAPLPYSLPTCPQPDVTAALIAHFVQDLRHCLRQRDEEDPLVSGPALLLGDMQ